MWDLALFVNETKCPDEKIVRENLNKIQHRGPDNTHLVHTIATPTVPKLLKLNNQSNNISGLDFIDSQ